MNRVPFIIAIAALVSASCAKNIPIPDVKITADDAQVARGKYLADGSMGCLACHSRRDWTHFGGPVIEGSEFGGSDDTAREDHFPDSFSFGGANLTPHHLKDWSDGEIVRAMLEGQDRERHGLFPLMPYMVWRDAVPLDDAVAVVAYLRTLKPLEHDAPATKTPIPGFVMDGFPEPRALKATAPKAGDAAYPAYVVARSACLDCHTNTDDRGKRLGEPYSGGREFKVPAPGHGTVRSANLTPDAESGLGKWTKEQFVAKFKTNTLEVARAIPVGDDGYNSIMPWWCYASMTDDDVGALWDFFHALAPVKNTVVKFTPSP